MNRDIALLSQLLSQRLPRGMCCGRCVHWRPELAYPGTAEWGTCVGQHERPETKYADGCIHWAPLASLLADRED